MLLFENGNNSNVNEATQTYGLNKYKTINVAAGWEVFCEKNP